MENSPFLFTDFDKKLFKSQNQINTKYTFSYLTHIFKVIGQV